MWLPALRVETVNPPAPLLRVAVPRVVDPSMNVTVPVGATKPPFIDDAMAVNVIA